MYTDQLRIEGMDPERPPPYFKTKLRTEKPKKEIETAPPPFLSHGLYERAHLFGRS